MTPRILVSAECQTGGVARTLQSVLRDVTVTPVPLYELPADDSGAIGVVSKYDIWVTADRHELFSDDPTGPRIVKCPRLNFLSFHPDVTYARDATTGAAPAFASSRIVTWAYSHRLSVNDTASLFHGDVFQALGYFNRWNEEVESLRHYYSVAYDLDFDPFYLSLKREGVFMHDITHPTAGAMEKLGKLVAAKIGAHPDDLARRVTLPDVFGELSWPVYPEIAEHLGLDGSYLWGETATALDGLRGYISYAFNRFGAHGFVPGSVDLLVNGIYENCDVAFDPILSQFVR